MSRAILVSPKTLQFFSVGCLKPFSFLNDFSRYISGQEPVKHFRFFFFLNF